MKFLEIVIRVNRKLLFNRFLLLVVSAIGIFSAEAIVLSKVASANEPVLIAQRRNIRVAHVVCSSYDIMIRFTGGNDAFSYQTQGLYLDNGESYENDEGDIVYDFFNGDFEYRVVTRDDGSATLFVLKYGETLLQKSCIWD